MLLAGVLVYPGRGKSNDSDVAAESVSGPHLAITGLAYPIQRLRLLQYRDLL